MNEPRRRWGGGAVARALRTPPRSTSVGEDRPEPASWWTVVPLLLIFLLLALLALRQVGSLDAGFHLKTGEYILDGHIPPRTDPFSFTMRDHAYVDTSWGYDVTVALIHRVAGATGLTIFHALLVLGTFALLLATVRLAPADPVTAATLLLAGGLASELRFEARPELVSYLCLALVLYILHRHAEGRPSPLWALPVVHLVWANLHGLFVLGWMATGCVVLGESLRTVWHGERRGGSVPKRQRDRRSAGRAKEPRTADRLSSETQGRPSRELGPAGVRQGTGEAGRRGSGDVRGGPWFDRRLAGWGAASVAVALVNPYGLRGFLFPLELATRLGEHNVFARAIGEFVSPFDLGLSRQFPFYPWIPIGSFRALVVLAAAAIVPLLFQRRIRCVLLTAGSLFLAYRMIRNLPVFVVASLPGLVWALPFDRGLRSIRLGPQARRNTARAAMVAVSVVAAALALRVHHDAYYIETRRAERSGLGWNRLELPVDAVDWAVRTGVAGPMLNHLNFGGYLMWARPEPVFIDGRLEVVGERFFEEYRAALASQEGLEACVSRYGIRWLLFPYAASPDLLGRLSRDPRWILAYRDHMAAAFVRAGTGGAPPIESALAQDLRPGGGPPAIPIAELPGLGLGPRTGRVALWVRGLGRRESFPSDEFNRGLFHIFRGELDLAGAYFASALRKSGGAYYEIYGNLGAVLFRQRRYAEARRCYEVVLSERPRDRTALERIAAIDRARMAPPAAAVEPAPAPGSERAEDAGPGRVPIRH